MPKPQIETVPAKERIRDPEGNEVPPGANYFAPPRKEMPDDVVYTCPDCGARHALSLYEIGRVVWDGALPEKTKYPDLDGVGPGWDIECDCGLVARLVGTFGDWGKMGSYYFGPNTVLERRTPNPLTPTR